MIIDGYNLTAMSEENLKLAKKIIEEELKKRRNWSVLEIATNENSSYKTGCWTIIEENITKEEAIKMVKSSDDAYYWEYVALPNQFLEQADISEEWLVQP